MNDFGEFPAELARLMAARSIGPTLARVPEGRTTVRSPHAIAGPAGGRTRRGRAPCRAFDAAVDRIASRGRTRRTPGGWTVPRELPVGSGGGRTGGRRPSGAAAAGRRPRRQRRDRLVRRRRRSPRPAVAAADDAAPRAAPVVEMDHPGCGGGLRAWRGGGDLVDRGLRARPASAPGGPVGAAPAAATGRRA